MASQCSLEAWRVCCLPISDADIDLLVRVLSGLEGTGSSRHLPNTSGSKLVLEELLHGLPSFCMIFARQREAIHAVYSQFYFFMKSISSAVSSAAGPLLFARGKLEIAVPFFGLPSSTLCSTARPYTQGGVCHKAIK